MTTERKPTILTTRSHEEAESLAALIRDAGYSARAVRGHIGVGVEDVTPSPASWIEVDGSRVLATAISHGIIHARKRLVDVRFGVGVSAEDNGMNFFDPKNPIGKAEQRQWMLDAITASVEGHTDAINTDDYFWAWCEVNHVHVRCGVVVWKEYYWANSSLYTTRRDVAAKIKSMHVIPDNCMSFGSPRIPQGQSAAEWSGDPNAILVVGG